MAEPTQTLANLRRAIGRLARNPFHLRYASGQLALTASTDQSTVAIVSTDLTQDDNFWKNQWVWLPTAEEERRIVAFEAAADRLIPEYPLSAAASSGDVIELWSVWSPTQVHEAINKSIDQAWRQYPDIVTDQTIVVEEDKSIYPTSGWSSSPWKLFQVWLEQNTTMTTGQPTSATATTLVDSNRDFSTFDTDHFVSIYFGTGTGQLREVSTGDSAGSLTVASWTTTPDTTSKYAVWDNGIQDVDWVRLIDYRPDQPEWPDNLYLPAEPLWATGLRMRLVYAAKPAILSSDAGTTVVPEQYITYKALSILHDGLIGDNRADRQMHASVAEYYDSLARAYLAEAPRRNPPGTIRTDGGGGVISERQDNVGDPLHWSRS